MIEIPFKQLETVFEGLVDSGSFQLEKIMKLCLHAGNVVSGSVAVVDHRVFVDQRY